jgi:hypothetical protein
VVEEVEVLFPFIPSKFFLLHLLMPIFDKLTPVREEVRFIKEEAVPEEEEEEEGDEREGEEVAVEESTL